MDPPALTIKHQKNTLRGKKTKKETIKNILGTPYDHYWPLLKGDDVKKLEEILHKHLPKMRNQKSTVPWNEIKHLPKDQRPNFRRKYNGVDSKPPDAVTKSSLIFGINEVTKTLEKNQAKSVLIASDVSPQLMVKHVVDLAVLRRTPSLVVPNLREILRNCSGIGSAAVALKGDLNEESSLWVIQETIGVIYKNYPIPKNHINYNRGEESFFDVELRDERMELIRSDVESEDGGCRTIKNDACVKDFYLYRESKERVFVPESSKIEQIVRTDKMEVDSNGFLSFGNDVSESVVVNGSDNGRYKSLVVKRIRSNKDRSKKKIAMLKTKKENNS